MLSAEYSKDDSVENYYDIRSGFFAAFDGNGADRSVGTNGKDGFKRTVDGVSLKLDGAWQGMVGQVVKAKGREYLVCFGSNMTVTIADWLLEAKAAA